MWISGAAKGDRARAAMAGPRSDPPMPILTMSVKTLAQRAANPALAHVAGESGDFFALRLDRRHDVLAIDQHRLAGKIAQGHVQGRAVFSGVDFFAGEQGVAPLLEFCCAGKVEQMAQRRLGQAIFRIIVDEIVKTRGKMRETVGIGVE